MDRNFSSPDDAVSIEVADQYCDLHNDYELSEIHLRPAQKYLVIRFTRNAVASKSAKALALSLVFNGLDSLEISPDFLVNLPYAIAEYGYKLPEDHDDAWLSRQDHATKEHHLFFRFEDDEYIRVHCMRVDAVLEGV